MFYLPLQKVPSRAPACSIVQLCDKTFYLLYRLSGIYYWSGFCTFQIFTVFYRLRCSVLHTCSDTILQVHTQQGNTLFYIYRATRLHNCCSIRLNIHFRSSSIRHCLWNTDYREFAWRGTCVCVLVRVCLLVNVMNCYFEDTTWRWILLHSGQLQL